MRKFFIFFFITLASIGYSQVTLIIESLPENTPEEDSIYMAGSLNGWEAGDEDFRLQKNVDGKWEIQLEAQADGSRIEFKFTRGNWGTVEKDANGDEMLNREFTFGNGEMMFNEIACWADLGCGSGQTTATENVIIIDESFYMPQLERNRRIWVYLPPNYHESDKTYPVLYMHDGQNLFDSYTAFAAEWEVDESLNKLSQEGWNVPIVVGIDNGGGHRMNEYSAWVNTQYGGGEGEEYLQFIVETLKPFIDENYHTKPERESTGIMGSSLGGLISHYAVFQYPDVFSKGGLFSPSYWFSDSIWDYSEQKANNQEHRIYQIIGSEEGYSAVNKVNEMHDLFMNHGFSSANLITKVEDGQGHNEAFWRQEFEEAYLWLFDDFASAIEEASLKDFAHVYPNPASNEINILTDKIDSLRVFNSQGVIVLENKTTPESRIDIQDLKPGLYFLEMNKGSQVLTSKFVKK